MLRPSLLLLPLLCISACSSPPPAPPAGHYRVLATVRSDTCADRAGEELSSWGRVDELAGGFFALWLQLSLGIPYPVDAPPSQEPNWEDYPDRFFFGADWSYRYLPVRSCAVRDRQLRFDSVAYTEEELLFTVTQEIRAVDTVDDHCLFVSSDGLQLKGLDVPAPAPCKTVIDYRYDYCGTGPCAEVRD